MNGLPDLPDLRILPAEALMAHERADENRVWPLVESLRAAGVLRNPPIVLPMGRHPERYVVLDGANRTLAMRKLALPHVLVQVAHAGQSQVRVETWNHVLLDVPRDVLRTSLAEIPELALVPSDAERAAYELSAGGTLAYLALGPHEVMEVVADTEPLELRLHNLDLLVAGCGQARIERTSAWRWPDVASVYPDASALLVFRRFEIEEVVEAAAVGRLLPAGLTRFVVSPRALRVNYPLERLAADRPIEIKQRELDEWVRERAGAHRVRYYAEATFLFDE